MEFLVMVTALPGNDPKDASRDTIASIMQLLCAQTGCWWRVIRQIKVQRRGVARDSYAVCLGGAR